MYLGPDHFSSLLPHHLPLKYRDSLIPSPSDAVLSPFLLVSYTVARTILLHVNHTNSFLVSEPLKPVVSRLTEATSWTWFIRPYMVWLRLALVPHPLVMFTDSFHLSLGCSLNMPGVLRPCQPSFAFPSALLYFLPKMSTQLAPSFSSDLYIKVVLQWGSAFILSKMSTPSSPPSRSMPLPSFFSWAPIPVQQLTTVPNYFVCWPSLLH